MTLETIIIPTRFYRARNLLNAVVFAVENIPLIKKGDDIAVF